MLPVNSGGHAAYQNFVVENLRKFYPDPDVFSKSTWDIIERFWNLDLTYTDELLRDKYSVFGLKPRTPSCSGLICFLLFLRSVPSPAVAATSFFHSLIKTRDSI